ncbi:hypothetical protein EYF80_044869 [Liparis tanakae]|uniref:Uncharacterized protein n=1 Tax=Liparis tanakae TaxID=230148 RepID=A0A4Z2FWG4_9TELE|nr:hypothetical protein EYF80_044869 [Liparis tanakae]
MENVPAVSSGHGERSCGVLRTWRTFLRCPHLERVVARGVGQVDDQTQLLLVLLHQVQQLPRPEHIRRGKLPDQRLREPREESNRSSQEMTEPSRSCPVAHRVTTEASDTEQKTHRPGAGWQRCVGEVGATQVPQVWDHEEGISNIGGGLEEASILLPPQG